MSQKLQHALHNEAASKFLRAKPEYTDWIITTAFYSALHFVEHFVFPFKHTVEGKEHTLTAIADYKRLGKSMKSKHELRNDLVKWKCPELEVPYEWLFNSAMSCRYYDYKFPNPKITVGLTDTYLKLIKKHCTTSK